GWTGRGGDVRRVVCGGVYEADVSRNSRKEKSPSLLGSALLPASWNSRMPTPSTASRPPH
ncbi:hypothetical protein BD311DRAFT_745121, partial [Dichomitus squalens]